MLSRAENLLPLSRPPYTYLGLFLHWNGLSDFRSGCAPPCRVSQRCLARWQLKAVLGLQDGGWVRLRVKRALRRGLVSAWIGLHSSVKEVQGNPDVGMDSEAPI